MSQCVNAQGQPAACQAPLSVGQVMDLVYQAGFRGADVIRMTAIVMVESSGIPNAYNPSSGTTGLAQIAPVHGLSSSAAVDPLGNLQEAYALYVNRIRTEGVSNRWADWAASYGGQAYQAFAANAASIARGGSGRGQQGKYLAEANDYLISGGAMGGLSKTILGQIGNAVGGVAGTIGGDVGGVAGTIGGLPGDIGGAITGGLSGLGDVFTSIANRLVWILVGLVLTVIGLVLLMGGDVKKVVDVTPEGAAAHAAEGAA